MKRDNKESYELPCERLLKNALAKAAGALEVGAHHRFHLLHHAQQPLRFHGTRGQAVIPQDVAVIPELGNKCARYTHNRGSSIESQAFLIGLVVVIRIIQKVINVRNWNLQLRRGQWWQRGLGDIVEIHTRRLELGKIHITPYEILAGW